MTDLIRLKSVQVGLHASAADVATFPGTLVPVQPRERVPTLLPRGRTEIIRDLVTVDGRAVPAAFGGKDLADVTLPLEVKGVNDNSGAAVSDWEAKLDIGVILESFFGAAAPATTGSAPTASGTAGTTLTASANVVQNGEVVIFANTAGDVFMRRVVSGGGTTSLVLDRAFTGTATGTIRRAAVYTPSFGKAHHTHIGVDVEGTQDDGSEWHQRLIGCAVAALRFGIPDTGLVTLDVTIKPTDFDQPAAASPAYAEPTAGAPIAAPALFYDGANAYDATGLSLVCDNGTVMRPTAAGPNGVKGGVHANKRATVLEGRVMLGDGTTPGGELPFRSGSPDLIELMGTDTDAGVVRTTRDLFVQVGKANGRIMGIWLPAASVHYTTVEAGDFVGVAFTARISGATGYVLAFG